MQENRPNPDELLKMIKRTEGRSTQGKLRIFIGMSAGVGKTYAMLSMAHEKYEQGADVLVAIVETHGRKDTMKILEGLPLLPRKKMEYGGTIIEDMDLEGVIEKKPQIALVDELAHTNPSGSRHHKRWQDVFEILENGIDVYTTINIQHIESKKDDIEKIASTTIFETVPDSIIERADDLEIIDLPPKDLIVRMKEGKVYLAEKAEQAINNFFQPEKLAALRQVLLRYAADKINDKQENDSSTINQKNNWKIQEKILLAIGHGQQSEHLIRTAKQSSDSFKCPWIALYVDTGKSLSEAQELVLNKNLDLARSLGAQVITTSDPDLIQAIDRNCKQHQITQVIIGKSQRHFFINCFTVEVILIN